MTRSSKFLAQATVALAMLAMPLAAIARTVIVVPHPDDESIGMAGTIREKVVAGEETWVILLTHGEGSGVFPLLNGERHCGLCGRTHNPITENYLPGDLTAGKLTRTTFGYSRVREFHGSLNQLGHPPERRRVYDYGSVSPAIATAVWQSVYQEFGPETDYYTVQGAMDTVHNDHRNIANALEANTDIPNHRKTFYAVYEFADNSHPNGIGALNPKSIAQYQEYKRSAMQQFMVWNPSRGRYRVGEHSTRNLIINSANWPNEYPYQIPGSSVDQWELY